MAEVDVVIIGGGIVGGAAAYELARRGLRCVVLERHDAVGRESSGAAAGLLGAQTEPPLSPFFDLLVEGHRRWAGLPRRLREETGIDIELAPTSGLMLSFTAAEARAAEKTAAAHRAAGFESQVLTAREACEREPALNPKSFKAALLLGGEHHLSASKATQAIARAAEIRGARFYFGAPITAIERPAKNRFVVKTAAAAFEAPWVVNAAGAWAGEVAGHVGLKVPVEPVRGQIFKTAPRPPFLKSVILSERVYAIQRQPGHVVIGATFERVGFDKRVLPETTARLGAAAAEILPALANAVVVESWVGLRPGTPDELPIFDIPAKVPGFVLANGHLRNGILLGPVTGEIVAALVTGEKPPVPLKPYALSRFGR
jgi:glycine oxidase